MRIVRLNLAVATLVAMVVCLAPTRALAQTSSAPQDSTPKNAIALAFGPSFGLRAPQIGGVMSLEYARRLSGALWLNVRPEFVLNLDHPSGSLMRGSAAGFDIGVEWQSAAPGQARLGFGGALGARLYNEPGLGGIGRVRAGFYVPIASDVFEIGARLSLEAGVARIGDEVASTRGQVRGDALAFAALSF
jgi:hypothetical protein